MEQDFPHHWLRFFANLLSQFWLRNLISNPNPPMFAAPSFSQFSSPYMSRCLSSRTDCTRSDMFRDCQPPRLQMLQHALCAGRYTTPRIRAPCPINHALETNSSRKTEQLARCRPRGNLKPKKNSRPEATAAGSQAGHKEKLHVCVRQVRLLARGTRCAAISSAGRFLLK